MYDVVVTSFWFFFYGGMFFVYICGCGDVRNLAKQKDIASKEK